jgi:hypothetical protein
MGNYSYRNWSSVLVFGADLYAINGAGSVHKFDSVSNTFVGFIVLPQPSVDARSTDNYLIITTRNSVYIYNNQMALVRQINSNQITNSNPLFSCATIIGDSVFIGTKENGLIVAALSSAGF